MENKEWYDIPEAAEELELSEYYIRQMVQRGVIASQRVPVSEGSLVTKHVIHKTELMEFSQREGAKTPRRKDGRGKQTFYATDEEVIAVKKVLYETQDPTMIIIADSIVIKNGYRPPSQRGDDETP